MTEVTEKTGKIYFGYNTGPGSQIVWVVTPKDEKYILKHVCRHSPDGFQWGYGGSGPADTALSILHDCVGKKDAGQYYQDFKWNFIAGAGSKLEVTEEAIRTWLAKKKDERWLEEFQLANCAGCRFADAEKVGTGKPCCTRAIPIDPVRPGKTCLMHAVGPQGVPGAQGSRGYPRITGAKEV